MNLKKFAHENGTTIGLAAIAGSCYLIHRALLESLVAKSAARMHNQTNTVDADWSKKIAEHNKSHFNL